MRKFLLMMALLIQSGLLFAQTHPKIWIRNNTGCPVYFKLGLSTAHTGAGSCIPGASSDVISVGPFSSVDNYNYSNVPGVIGVPAGSVRAFLMAFIMTGPSICSTISSQAIGQSCLVPSTTWTYSALNSACSPCGTVTATWSVSGGIIFLDFT